MNSEFSVRHKALSQEVERLNKNLKNFLNEKITPALVDDYMLKMHSISQFVRFLNNDLEAGECKVVNGPAVVVESEKEDYSHYLVEDTSRYELTPIFSGIISYIKNEQELLIYVWNQCEKKSIEELAKRTDLPKCTSVPKTGQLFGVYLDDVIFRAMINPHESSDVPNENLIIRLIDMGEDVEFAKTNDFYVLPANVKEIPPQSILCKVVGFCSKNDINAPESELRECLKPLTVQMFYLETTTPEYSVVRLIPNAADLKRLKNCNSKTVKTSKTTSGGKKSQVVTKVKKSVERSDNHLNDAIPLSAMTANIEAIDKYDLNLSNEELEDFYSNQTSTMNAVKAVIGFQPKYDKNICRFYDPKTGGCFKGANCTLDHVAMPKNALTSDVLTVMAGCNSISYKFDINQEIMVWEDNDIASFKMLKNPPLEFDLVMARYSDGKWYRAKVLRPINDTMYEVFYVDYGNRHNVPLKHMANCYKSSVDKPFQAHLFHFENLRDVASVYQRIEGLNAMAEMVNQSYNVRVMCQNENVYVRFSDKTVNKLLRNLLKLKLLEECKNVST